MDTFDTTPTEAEGSVAAIFEDIRRVLDIDFVPRFFQVLAHAPGVLRGTWNAYRHVGWQGQLPVSMKEMVFTAVAAARGCRYCEAAHLAFCRKLGVDSANLRALVTNIDDVQPPKTREVVRFAVAASRDPLSIDDDRFQTLRDHGLTDAHIIELLAMVSFALYASNLADAMKIAIDQDFLQLLGSSVDDIRNDPSTTPG